MKRFQYILLLSIIALTLPSLGLAQLATNLLIGSINGGSSPSAGVPFEVVVYATDGSSNRQVVLNPTTVQLSVAAGSGTLGGTTSGIIPIGFDSVLISGVTYTIAESGVAFTGTGTSGDALLPSTSSSFTVTPGPASTLKISVQPGSPTNAGLAFTPQPSIRIEDNQGNLVTSNTSTITALIATGTSTLQGATTATASGGVATFSNLSYQKAESITLTFQDGSLTPATSSTIIVQPAGASTSTSTVTANPTSLTADGSSTSTITVQLKDAFGNNLTASGGPVVVNSSLGSIGTTTDNGNGTYSATLTAGPSVGTATVTATLNSVSLTDNATVAFTAGSATKFAITMSGSITPLSAVAKSAGTAFLVRVTAQDVNGNTVSGYTGTVSLTSNAFVGTVSAVISSGGLVDNISVTPTSPGAANRSITASDGTITTTNASGNFTVNPGAASTTTSTVSANPTSIPANGSSTSAITVQLKDALGNNLIASGGSVVINASLGPIGLTVDNGNGTYSATLTSATSVGTSTVSATLNAVSLTSTATVAFTAGSATKFAVTMSGSITPLSAVAKSAGTAFLVRVTAQDVNGNTVPTYTGTVSLTSNAFVGTVSAVISSGGLVDNISVTPTVAGAANRSITASDGTITTANASGNFTVNPGAASTTTSTVTANPTSIPANGSSTSTITVQLKDQLGNILIGSGGSVVIGATLGAISGTTDNGNGTYSATLTSATSVGTSTVSATLNAVSLTSTATVAFTVGSATKFAITMSGSITPLSAVAKTAGSAFLVRVTAQDGNGNTVPTYTGTVSLTSNAFVGTIPAVISSGGLVDNISVTPTAAGVANRSITASDGTITTANASGNFTVNPGAASTATSTVTANPTSIPANGSSTSTITVQLKDQLGNNLIGSGGSVVIGATLGAISGTTDNGNGTYSATLTSATSVGTSTVSATLNAVSLTSTATVAFTVGSATKFAITMSGSITPLSAVAKTAGSAFLVRVTAQDGNGNTVPTYTGTVSLTSNAFVGTVPAVISSGGLVDNTSVTPTAAGVANRSITASDGTITTANASGNFTVNPGAASTTTSTVSANPTSIPANGSSTSLITVQLKDALGNNLTGSGGSVVIGTTLGAISGTTDNGNGTYSATLTAGPSVGTATVTATLNSVSLTDNATVAFTAGSVSKFAITMSGGITPLSVVAKTAGSAFLVRVTAQDVNGNTVPGYTGTVSLTSNAFVGTIPAVISSGGLVDNISVTPTAAGVANRSITASDGTITTTNASGNFTVNPGAASTTTSTVSANPTSIPANGTSTSLITVQLKDAFGNNLTSSGGTVVIGRTLGTIGLTVDNANGTYSATLTSATSVGTSTVSATLNAVSLTSTATVAFTAGSTAKFAVTMSGGTTALSAAAKTAGVAFLVRVTAQDVNGNTVPTYTGTVNLTSSTFSGTVPATISSGGLVDNVTIAPTIAGSGRTIAATDGSITTSPASSTFVVNTAPAKKLLVTRQPSSAATAGQVFATQPQVSIEDSLGNVITTDNATIITVQAIGGTGTLGGTLTATAASGVATFTNLSYAKSETIRLRFSSGALIPDTSNAIVVASGGATKLVVRRQPSAAAIAGQNFATQPQVALEDGLGNVIATDNSTVVAVQVIGGTGGTLRGTTSVTVAAGVATFTNLNYTKMESIRLRFTAGALTPDTSGTIVVNHGAAVSIAKVSGDGQTGPISTSLSPMTVHVADAFGNPVDSTAVTFAWTIVPSGASGQVVNPTTAFTNASGNASSVLTLGNKVGTYTVQATAALTGSPITFTASATAGAAGRVVILQQPSSTQIAGRAFSPIPTVSIQDASGNIVPDNSSIISATLSRGSSPLQGSTSVQVVNGIAAFSSLSYPVAEQIQVQFSSPGLTAASTGLMTVGSDSAYALSISQQPPGRVTAGVNMFPALKVQLIDRSGNPVSKSGTNISVSVSGGIPGLLGTLTRPTDATGLATFTDLHFTATGGRRLQFASPFLTRAVSDTLTVDAAPPDTLVFVVDPSNVHAGIPFSTSPVVEARDRFGNIVTGVALNVSLALTNPVGASLVGTTTVAIDQSTGRATFAGLSVNRVGTFTLTAGSLSVPKNGVSAPFSVSPGPPARLAFTAQPTPDTAGNRIRPAIVVAVQDTFGNIVTSSSDSIGLSLVGGGVLLGSGNKQASAGIATFDSVIITLAGPAKVLLASAKTLTPATSVPFLISPAAPSRLVFSTQPGNGTAGIALSQQPVVTMQDKYGNTVTGIAEKVSLAIKDTATFGAKLLVAPLSANVDTTTGLAVFSSTAIDKAGHGYTLTATGSTVTPLPGVVVSDTFAISPGNAQKVLIETLADGHGSPLVNQKVSSGTSIIVYAIARDAFDNYVANVAANVGGWFLTVYSGGIIPSDLVVGADRRSAVFSGHVIGAAQINVSVTGLLSVLSDTLTVVQAGTPSKVVVETADNGTGQVLPAQSLESGTSIRMYAIARDASNNFVSNIGSDWILIKLAGGIADPDLVPSVDKKSAVFTAHRTGRAQIFASTGSLAGVRSDTITVVHGTAAVVVPLSGTTPQSTSVGSMFANPLAAQVVDSSGNPVPSAVIRFSAPVSGPSSLFGTQQDTSVAANSSGIATAPAMRANTIAGTYTDSALVHGATPALFSLTNTAANVRSFSITSTNGGQIENQFAQVEFQVRIAARDSLGNIATGFTGSVVVGSQGMLMEGGGTTQNFVNGILASYPIMFDSSGAFVLTARRTGGSESGVSDTIHVGNPAPTVSSISPGNGLAGTTLDLTVKGTGFITGVTVVLFSDFHIQALTPRIDSFTQMTLTVKIDSSISPGTKNVTVANIQPGGGTVVIQNGFTVGNNPAPTLTALIPAAAGRSQTINVALLGSNFIPGASTADFGQGINVNSLKVDSATHMTAALSIASTAQLGDHAVTVTNGPPGGGTSQSATFTVNADPSTAPRLAAPPAGFSVQTALVTLQWSTPPSDSVASYQVQVAIDTSFASPVVDSTVTGLSMQIGPLSSNSTFYWHVRARRINGGTSSFSDRGSFNTYPTLLAITDTVAFPSYGSPGSYKPSDYRLVGLPGSDSSRISKYFDGTPGSDWIVYYDNGADSSYYIQYVGQQDSLFSFARGRGFWVLRRGTWSVNAQVGGMLPDSTGHLRIPLHTGWNIITNPTLLPMAWPKVQNANGGIGDSIWTYDGLTMGVAQTFAPYVGYYFENKSHLKFLALPGGNTLSGTAKIAASIDSSWVVGLSLERSGALIDRSTWFGVAADALPDNDRHDFHKPRSIGALSQLMFDRPAWDRRASRFASDIRPPISTVESWNFTAMTPEPSSITKEHTIRFAGVNAVPMSNDIYLIDRAREIYQDLRKNSAYTFTPSTSTTQFTILVGTAAEIRKQLDQIGPKEFGLDQNYPNPFNPSTTISLSVPIKANVTVTIYDILGARVRILETGVLEPGRHFFRWEGTNDAGKTTGTGVYICRMSVAGGPSFTRKMLLLR